MTWPISTTAVPVRLANATKRAADSLSCDTEPGLASTSAVAIVWIESTTSTRAPAAVAAARIDSTPVSASTARGPAARPRRRARSPTCRRLSSPVAYTTGTDGASAAAACSSSVDLPMPGSPPISVTEPATSPPPSTRSNSPEPVARRGASTRAAESSVSARPAAAAGAARARAGRCATACAVSVFQASQDGHWPCHLGELSPQALQT